MNKTIDKASLDKAIEAVRHYYDPVVINEEGAAKEMLDICRAVKPIDCFIDLLSSILRYKGLKHNATNEDIYKVLEVLGWSVK